MATSIRGLKKDVKKAFETLIGEALLMQVASGDDNKKTSELINEMVDAYETFIQKINAHRQEKDKKAYFKSLNEEISRTLQQFQEKVNAL